MTESRRKRKETPEQQLDRLIQVVQQLEEENKSLRAKMRWFTPTEWKDQEYRHGLKQARAESRSMRADAGQTWAQENNYPELSGSPKQTKWALAIRQQIVEQFRKEQSAEIAAQVEPALKEKTEAVWWIVRRPTGDHFNASSLLAEDRVNDNTWSDEVTPCPGVNIPGFISIHTLIAELEAEEQSKPVPAPVIQSKPILQPGNTWVN